MRTAALHSSGRGDAVPVIICADDYAFAPGVDEGILALAVQGRISALSCMAASPRWPRAVQRLRPLFGKLDVGLHFTLTQLAPLGPMPQLAPADRLPSLGSIYRRSFLRQIDPEEVAHELKRQLDAFASGTGRTPDFLDSHHHVHQLPGIRDTVVRVWHGRRYRGWIRNTTAAGALRQTISWRVRTLSSFGRAAERSWRAAGIATNRGFAGVRSFRERAPFGALMRAWLAGATPGLLIMCHPGYPDDELARLDSVTTTRAEELAYLSGAEFPADLAAAGCRLARFSELAAQ